MKQLPSNVNKADHEYALVRVNFIKFILIFPLQATLFLTVFGSYVTVLVWEYPRNE